MYSWLRARISGRNCTLPGLYTPCTLPNAAAIVKRSLTSMNCS